MRIRVLKSKLHRGAVTGADLHYEGSLGLSTELIEAAGFYEYEEVQVLNIDTGDRFRTYIIEEEEPGRIVLNGAAARLGRPGDRVIVMSYADVEEASQEHMSHQPTVIRLDEDNQIVEHL